MSSRDYKSDLIDISCKLIAETDRAFLVSDDGGKTKHWVPKSQCEYDEDSNTLTMPEWLAKDKELI